MSTRCQIGVYAKKPEKLDSPEVLLYRHSDGYPEGVLPDLKKFLKFWKEVRGLDDVEYLGARLIQWFGQECDRLYQKDSYKQHKEEDMLTGIYGYGICKNLHWDIKYYYAIYPSAVEVYEMLGSQGSYDDMKFIKVIKI